MQYKVLTGRDNEDIESIVQIMIDEAWRPYGSPFVKEGNICQAMIMETLDDEDDITTIPSSKDDLINIILKYFSRPAKYDDYNLLTTMEIAEMIKSNEKDFNMTSSTIRAISKTLFNYGFNNETTEIAGIVKIKWQIKPKYTRS